MSSDIPKTDKLSHTLLVRISELATIYINMNVSICLAGTQFYDMPWSGRSYIIYSESIAVWTLTSSERLGVRV